MLNLKPRDVFRKNILVYRTFHPVELHLPVRVAERLELDLAGLHVVRVVVEGHVAGHVEVDAGRVADPRRVVHPDRRGTHKVRRDPEV